MPRFLCVQLTDLATDKRAPTETSGTDRKTDLGQAVNRREFSHAGRRRDAWRCDLRLVLATSEEQNHESVWRS
jgi:hypothetical protein